MKTIPIRITINGQPRRFNPVGAKFYIPIGNGVSLVFSPRWYVKENKKDGLPRKMTDEELKTAAIQYDFIGIETFQGFDTLPKS